VAAYDVDVSGARAKVREPGLVLLWHILTLGIYNWFWYYAINRELRDFGETSGDEELARSNPGLSLLAVTLGWLLIVPPFVSWWRCTGRIRRAQRNVEAGETNGWIIGLCYFFGFFNIFWLAIPVYVQDGLNEVWKKFPRADASPMTSAAAQDAGADQAGEMPVAGGEVKLSDIAKED
jgi:Na+/proline symporter